MSDTHSDVIVQLVWYSSAVLLLMTLLLLVLTLFMHYERRQRDKSRQQATEQWTPILFSWIYSPDENTGPLPQLTAEGFGFVVQLWLQLEQTVRGSASSRLAELAQQLNLIPVMKQWLHGYSTDKKLTAIMALGIVQEKSAFADLIPHVLDKRTIFSLVAARALLAIDPKLGLPVILSQIHRDDWSVSRLAGLLVRLPHDLLVRSITECAEKATAKELRRLIKLMHILSPIDSQPLIQQALVHYPDEMELLTTAFACAVSPDLLPLLRQQVDNPQWEVRVQLAKALARLGDSSDGPLLLKMLSDSSWWVRYRAAQSLVALPGVEGEQLQQWQQQLTDPFAIAILLQVKEEQQRQQQGRT
ncbi:HEAT repeat domain-containing protein [Rheinheimera sp. 1928-s]|uniref:HEAT repeat domain-containing protein n=1 Tax=Rheinheimera sp. 1928-s TaxID=3033803 RepID=UPI00260DC318|nr:HEAT repeat domain-containing protein [Rheinheimera sp. 1928-s]MDF3125280.1 HEAT repeat domain-containing protein [Rheinheimera sp. 1928-s]